MAAAKSASRKSAAKKAAKTRKSRAAGKKAAATRKRRVAGKKAAATRKRRVAGKKAAATRKTRSAAIPAHVSPEIADIDGRIAMVRNNLRDLVEQATGYSGASTEDRMSDRITEQEARLAALIEQREKLVRAGS